MRRIPLGLSLITLGISWYPAVRAQTPPAPVTASAPPASADPRLSEVEKRAALSGFAPLRTSILPLDDVELRLWEGTDAHPADRGYVIRRRSGVWSADLVPLPLIAFKTVAFRLPLSPPSKGGWKDLWHSLQEQGVLTLPTQTQAWKRNGNAQKGQGAAGGPVYFVEVYANGVYRTGSGALPERADHPEDEPVDSIGNAVTDAFWLNVVRLRASINERTPMPEEAEAHLLHDSFTESKNFSTIPPWAKQMLTEENNGHLPRMANGDEEFEKTDMVTKPGLPFARLNFVATAGDYCCLSYERGGIGYSRDLLLFHRSGVNPLAGEVYRSSYPMRSFSFADVRAWQAKYRTFKVHLNRF